MIISKSRKFIFVHLHKCAGTSVTVALQPFLSMDDLVVGRPGFTGKLVSNDLMPLSISLRKHSSAEDISVAVGDAIWRSYFKFAFVRHPVDRLVSLYEFLMRVRSNNEPNQGFKKNLLSWMRNRDLTRYPDQPPWNWLSMHALLTTDDFSGFIRSEYLANAQDAKPQTRSLTDGTGNLLVDFVGKVENMRDDWHHLCDQLGIQAPLLNENKSDRKFAELGKYLKTDDLEFVTQKYRSDFDLFGYSPNDIS